VRGNLLANVRIRDYLNNRILCEVGSGERRVALTFDDGPNPYHTPRLLDLLAARGVRATFFVVGRRVSRFGALLERMATEGQEIGNHCFMHFPLIFMTADGIRAELTRTEALIARHTGTRSRFMRPPMGWFNERVLRVSRELGYEPVIGSINPHDSKRPGTGAIVERVLHSVKPGAIIILHDGGWRISVDRRQTLAATERLIDGLTERGYAIGTLGELVDSAGA
jgi:peptidoglycan/xylan/chitin deacetylase (PgdA/CDA1 family)